MLGFILMHAKTFECILTVTPYATQHRFGGVRIQHR